MEKAGTTTHLPSRKRFQHVLASTYPKRPNPTFCRFSLLHPLKNYAQKPASHAVFFTYNIYFAVRCSMMLYMLRTILFLIAPVSYDFIGG